MKDYVYSILEYILVFLIIISCNTVYMNFMNSNISRIIIVLYCIIMILMMFIKGLKIQKFNKFLLFLFIYYIYMAVFYFFNNIGQYTFEFISYLCILLPLIILFYINSSSDKIKSLLIKLKKLVIIFACISLVFYLLTNLNLISNYKYVSVRWGTTQSIPSILNIYYMPQGIIRNSLFYVEPTMFGIFLVLAMAIEKIDKNNIYNKILLFLVILTTRSATGILIALLIFVFDSIKKNNKGIIKMLTPIFIVAVILIGVFVFNKKTLTMSYKIRIDDYKACLTTWKQNPLFGVGFMNTKSIQENMNSFRRFNLGLSNSLFVILAQGGIYLLILYIIPIFNLFKNFKKQKETLVIIIFLILLVTTIFHLTILTFNGLAIGLSLYFKELGDPQKK